MKEYCMEHGIQSCELRLPGCTGSIFLTFAHRKKRRFYTEPEQLYDRSQWRLACVNCHEQIEYDKELTERVFNGTA
jgi:hypothetical protein